MIHIWSVMVKIDDGNALLYLLTVNQSASPSLMIDMTQDSLAELLGLSRVQVTRGLTELQNRKIISTDRYRINVINLPLLSELCTSESF